MGTNTPHTCIPGLVWQKQARRFSQFEFKVGELRFPIHFACVSAALYHRGVRGRHFPLRWIWPITSSSFVLLAQLLKSMVRTSKTDHFFKLAPFWSPLTDLVDFGMAGKLLTSATRWCSPYVDSVSRIWIKPKKSLIGCWAPTATTFGQSAPPRVQQTAGRNGHNRHFERMSLVSSVCRSLCTGKIKLYVSWVAYFRGILPWLQRTAVTPVGFGCTGAISRVIVKVTSSSDLEKNTRTQQIYV